jgi:hypothetical protein
MLSLPILVLLSISSSRTPIHVDEANRFPTHPAPRLEFNTPSEHLSTANASKDENVNEKDRIRAIRIAQVWTPTDVSSMDLRKGPPGPDAFPAGATVSCEFVRSKRSGSSPKFNCRLQTGETVKVRYGGSNGEVQGSVLAGRLLWALGFGADRVYPVRILCRGCSDDPWSNRGPEEGMRIFDPAVIERKPKGRELVVGRHSGWGWQELSLVDEASGGAPIEQRDALRLLAVFMQHTDNKAEQQRLLCLPDPDSDAPCASPFLALHDVGLTFGRATRTNHTDTSSVNFVEWAKTPIWRDPQQCIGNLLKSNSGTLENPKIHEAGRAFLARLLTALTDAQLHDLFDVARVELRSKEPDNDTTARPPASVAEWVDVFKQKREEIESTRCPDGKD